MATSQGIELNKCGSSLGDNLCSCSGWLPGLRPRWRRATAPGGGANSMGRGNYPPKRNQCASLFMLVNALSCPAGFQIPQIPQLARVPASTGNKRVWNKGQGRGDSTVEQGAGPDSRFPWSGVASARVHCGGGGGISECRQQGETILMAGVQRRRNHCAGRGVGRGEWEGGWGREHHREARGRDGWAERLVFLAESRGLPFSVRSILLWGRSCEGAWPRMAAIACYLPT